MRAIYEFDAKDMPVTVAVSVNVTSAHNTGQKEWPATFAKISLVVA